MSRTQRQLAILGGLLVVLAGTLVMYTGDAAPDAAPAAVSAAQTPGAPARAIPVSGLRLDLLTARADDLEESTRNPFRFQARPAPAGPRVVAAPPRAEPIALPVPTGPPPPPPIPLKFIGLLDAPSRLGRLAVLSDSRGGVFYGKEGDTIEGRYRVLRISTESADLAYLDGRGRQTIRLSGQ
ncbi:MAG: hypothetical protein ABL986_16455 [Vicinamibacterales bacterium]